MQGGRKVSELDTDIVAEVAGIEPAGKAQAGRTIGESGPTQVRRFLIDRAPRGAYSVDMLDEAFATNLAALIQ
ncbi:hypothetical protein AB4144_67945, partial [Rhizobiaceae sp. 2RAB30]